MSWASMNVTEVFAGLGMKDVTAEAVAEEAIAEARDYLAAEVPVGAHLTDQLLVPLALAGGGSFLTQTPTEHTRTNARVIEMFLAVTIALEEVEEGKWRVEVRGSDSGRSVA